MSKLDDILPILYRDMHAAGAFAGEVWRRYEKRLEAFLPPDATPVVDFGCGPRGGLSESAAFAGRVLPYDPYVAAYRAPPWSRRPRAVFSCDVLEHLPVPQLRRFAAVLASLPSVRHVFLAVSTRAANKVMPNGLNAHLTVRPVEWWLGFFECGLGCFRVAFAEADVLARAAVFGLVRDVPREDC